MSFDSATIVWKAYDGVHIRIEKDSGREGIEIALSDHNAVCLAADLRRAAGQTQVDCPGSLVLVSAAMLGVCAGVGGLTLMAWLLKGHM